MNALVFLCVVFGSMTSQTAMAITGTTSCTATPVQKGESVIITCDFGKNISKPLPVSFTVEQYPSNENSKEVSVLDCNWIDTDQPQCQPSTGYTFDGRTLRFVIENASERHTGRYACKTMSQVYKPDPQICTFQLADGSTTPGPVTDTSPPGGPVIENNEGSFPAWIIVVVVVAVCVIVGAVIVGVLYWLRRKGLFCRKGPKETENELQDPMLDPNDSEMNRAAEPTPGEKEDIDALANSPQPKDAENNSRKSADSMSSQPETQQNAEDKTGLTKDVFEQDSISVNVLLAEEGTETSDEKNDQGNTPQSADTGAQDSQDKEEDVPSVENPSED